MSLTPCPGCRALLPDLGLPSAERLHASGECWTAYGEFSAEFITRAVPDFPYQHVVDAYAAQHAGGPSKPITTAFALIGLYLWLERGLSGREVQRAHMVLGRKKRIWPAFPPPAVPAPLTLQNVRGGESSLREWGEAVWASWEALHTWTREYAGRELG